MNNDFFLFDRERLQAIASDDTVKQGLAYYAENRVFDLELTDNVLTAQVEDADAILPYWIELSRNGKNLDVRCDCSPAGDVCKHAIAALYAYAGQSSVDHDKILGNAVDEAILERVKKGRNEVNVKLLSGNIGFGVWQASSIMSATFTKRSYQVHIRSLDQRMNYCTCPDLATNRLGTCKHIEAVLHQAQKSPDYPRLKEAGSPLSFVYLSWESATRPVLRLFKTPSIAPDLANCLQDYFNPDGVFTGRVPEDFFRFSERVQGREDFLLGDDAVSYVYQCADDAAQALRAQHIHHQILKTNGVLPGIKARLFPYQTEGVAFLASRGRALLADDMGLGKTLQAITAATWLADHDGVEKILVICPASLKHQWAREIDKFTGRPAQIVEGNAESRLVQYRSDAPFVIVNYELTMRDLSVICDTLKPDLVILDEAQRIKNWRTKLASNVKLIPSRYVFVLSGTPLENRLEDLYSLLQMVDARVLGPLWRCLLEFHVTDERGKIIGYRNLSELRQRIAPVMLRRSRSLVSDQLPERTEVRLDIPLSPKQRELHDSALSAAGKLAQIAKQRPLTPSEQNRLMSALQQARMACDAAGLVDKNTQGSPKLDELARLLEELCLQSNRKAVIFSQWALMTELVEAVVRSLKLGCVRLHGGIPSSKRGVLMDRFLNDDAIQVFISTDAGGVGLNLQAATVLINLDMPWNPAVLDQRIARIHRLGQKRNVQIFLLLAEDSYEQQVARLVQGKRDLFDNVVSPEASEDVVGVSKKMLETLIDDLNVVEPEPAAVQTPSETLAHSPDDAGDVVRRKQQPDDATEVDAGIRHLIGQLQTAFQDRLVRILGAGGGLLAVVDPYRDADESIAESLSLADVPVAVIDSRTLASLRRLGAASPVAGSHSLFEAKDAGVPKTNPLLAAAEAKLRSAEMLLNQQVNAGVMDLLASAMLIRAAALAGLHQAPPADSAVLWLYAEALPKQILSQDQVTAIVRALSLSQAPEVPIGLIEQTLMDARMLCSIAAPPA